VRLNYLSILILLGVFIAGHSYAYDPSFAINTASVNIPPGADIAAMGNAWTAAPNFSSNNPAVIAAGDNFKFSGSATYGLIGFKNNKSLNIYSGSVSAHLPAGTLQAGYSYSSSGRVATNEGDEMKLSAPMSVDVMYGFNAANNVFREGDRLFAGIGYGNGLSKLSFSTDGTDTVTSRSRGNTYSTGVLYSPDSGLNVAAYYAYGREKNKDYDTMEDMTTYSTSNINTARIGLSWQALPETLIALDYQHLESDGRKKDQIFAGIEQGIIKDRLYIYSGWAGNGPTLGVGLYFKNGGINIAYMHNQFDDLSDYLGTARLCMLTGYLSF
jgi:hypothetical protein